MIVLSICILLNNKMCNSIHIYLGKLPLRKASRRILLSGFLSCGTICPAPFTVGKLIQNQIADNDLQLDS